jgi:hypothetical protein
MNNVALVSSIREDLGRIAETSDAQAVQLFIQSINRSIRKLTAPGSGESEVLTRLGIDLLDSYKSEMALMTLSGKTKTLSDGFFKSFSVLRKDLEKALDEVKG